MGVIRSTGFVAGLARQVARHNVIINNIRPGPFLTDRLRSGFQEAAKRTNRSVDEVVAAGGGVKNPALMGRIEALLAPVRVRRSDELGVPSDAREAMAFAVLADMTLRGQAACLPPVTGAAAPKVLGKLSFP